MACLCSEFAHLRFLSHVCRGREESVGAVRESWVLGVLPKVIGWGELESWYRLLTFCVPPVPPLMSLSLDSGSLLSEAFHLVVQLSYLISHPKQDVALSDPPACLL